MDIKEAFADGDFGSGQPAPHEREPAAKEEPTDDRRDAVEPKEALAASTADDAGDDDDGEREQERPQDLEQATRALTSERSISRKHRGELKKALAAQRDLEARHAKAMERLAALERQAAPQPKPEAPKVPELTDDDFYAKGPAYVRELMEQREQALLQNKIAPLEQRVAMTQIMAAEEAWRATYPDYDAKKAVCQEHMRHSQDLRDQFNAVAAGQHPVYRSIAHFVYEYAKQAEHIEQLLNGAGAQSQQAGADNGESGDEPRERVAQRRTPLTLAGRRGGGSGVTPAPAFTPIEKAFSF